MMLPDGSVAPSFLELQGPPDAMRDQTSNEFALRVGTIVASYAPDVDESLTKSAWEYDVSCVITDGMGQPTQLVYQHAVLASAFGSISDYFLWAPRISEKSKSPTDKPDQDALLQGSTVCLLAPNGNSSTSALILCGAQHFKAPTADKKYGDGPLMRFEYNGVNVEINKDGELTLTRKGPTKIDGTPVKDDDKDVGATITLDAKGRVNISSPDLKQFTIWGREDGDIQHSADKKMTFNVDNGKIETTASQGVKLGGTEPLVLGNKYTQAESNFLQGMTNFMTTLLVTLTAVGTALAASPAAAAAVPLQSPTLANAFSQFIGDIQTFSGHLSGDVLSQKNTTE